MGRSPGTSRLPLPWMLLLVSLLSGCSSVPATDDSISPRSSLLAVDVLFPAPLSRDTTLVQVFFVKGPIHAGLDELPELIPATFVKWSRAYLLDPEAGTYSVVAVSSAYAPPWNDHPIAGVDKTTWSRTSSDAMIFPAELIRRTTTTVAPGRVAFMGALRVRRGERLDAKAAYQDVLQRRLAEHIRPGVTSESGFAGWLKRTRGVDLEETSLSNELADRESFFADAIEDLGASPWARVVARAAPPSESAAVRSWNEPSGLELAAEPPDPIPAVAAQSRSVARDSEDAPPALPSMAPAPAPTPGGALAASQRTTPKPAAPPRPTPPERRPIPGLPPDSPLSQVEYGMSHHDVRKILGAPDDRIDRLTAKAWIPFYSGAGANLRDWIYDGTGRVVFSLYKGRLTVVDVVYDPDQGS